MNMECLYTNYFNTTTLASVSSGTGTVSNLFDRTSNKWQSSSENDDTITSSIRIDFNSAQEVDRLILQNINFKSFKIYYDSTTANLFSVTSALTGTSAWSSNSATSLYLLLADTKTITSLTIEATATMVANKEKEMRELRITAQQYAFVDNPTSKNYKAMLKRKEYLHEMSDGGTTQYVLDEKFKADIKRTFVLPAEETNLYSLYSGRQTFIFTPEPTGTSWNDKIYEVNWVGDYDFEQFADNYKGNGYSGMMRLRETPS